MWIGDSEWARDVKIAGGQKDAMVAVMEAVHGQDNTGLPSGRLTRLQLLLSVYPADGKDPCGALDMAPFLGRTSHLPVGIWVTLDLFSHCCFNC